VNANRDVLPTLRALKAANIRLIVSLNALLD
jgi:hypothetical protein